MPTSWRKISTVKTNPLITLWLFPNSFKSFINGRLLIFFLPSKLYLALALRSAWVSGIVYIWSISYIKHFKAFQYPEMGNHIINLHIINPYYSQICLVSSIVLSKEPSYLMPFILGWLLCSELNYLFALLNAHEILLILLLQNILLSSAFGGFSLFIFLIPFICW